MKKLFALAGLGAGLALSACGDDAPAAAPPPPPSTSRKTVEVADAGSDVAPYLYSYNPIAKRDPFRGSTDDTGGQSAPEPTRSEATCDEPLCQFDIDELTLVAVVSGDSNPIAMVEDRTGVGHMVRRNTRLGKGGGKVTSILRDCMVVTSFVRGADGRAQPNRQNMCVKKESRQMPVVDLMNGKLRE